MIAIDYVKNKLNDNQNFCYLTKIANEHLSEYVDKIDNIVEPLTNFTGDTAYLYLDKYGFTLLVDERFTIQAVKETRNIIIVTIHNSNDVLQFLLDRVNEIGTELRSNFDNKYYKRTKIDLYIDNRLFSYDFITNIESKMKKLLVDVYYDYDIVNHIRELNITRYNNYYKKKILRKLFNYGHNNINNIYKLLDEKKNEKGYNNYIFVTSNLSLIANITNLRLKPNSINDDLLFESYLLIINKNIYLYTDYDIINKDKTNIILKKYNNFYVDISNLNSFLNQNNINLNDISIVFIDFNSNSHYLIDKIINTTDGSLYFLNNININNLREDSSSINDNINLYYSIKSDEELLLLKEINVIDAIVMIKYVYALKHFDFDKYKLTEYSLKKILDLLRSKQKNFLSTSFDTIVSYKENSAICHYSPKENGSKVISNDSILLIDSGGNYIGGTTDITRVVSLYKDKNKIPQDVKHYYTLVLKSLLTLSNQKFPVGYSGFQLDIIARQYLFNECLDYGHGTGHGIGNNTSVHYGTNIFTSRIINNKSNILTENQVQSCEPGVYFENKYGIRLENDTYVKHIKKTNFLTFDTLTLCPFDCDLIEYDELDKIDIERLNNYNKKIYNTMKKYFNGEILSWLKENTMYL